MASIRFSAPIKRVAALKVATLFAVTMTFAGCMAGAQAPKELDYSRTRTSATGLYRGRSIPDGDSIPTGKLQRWTLHLETANGTPVDVAKVTVDGGMPQHGHGLPTKPQLTRALGEGNHVVEGMKFNMGGWWVVKFRVSSTAGNASLDFNLSL